MSLLVLLRHGESQWNARDVFTGWTEVALSPRGEEQARQAGAALAARGALPDVVHTSVQDRAIWTACLALEGCGRSWVPVRRSWRLNSNHYGALEGRGKQQTRAELGAGQVREWRRAWDAPPPPGTAVDDPRYAAIPPRARPAGESLKEVSARLLPYWADAIVPDLARHGCVLVASHGNALRALVKHLEGISDEAVADLEVPNARPLYYDCRAGRVTRLPD